MKKLETLLGLNYTSVDGRDCLIDSVMPEWREKLSDKALQIIDLSGSIVLKDGVITSILNCTSEAISTAYSIDVKPISYRNTVAIVTANNEDGSCTRFLAKNVSIFVKI